MTEIIEQPTMVETSPDGLAGVARSAPSLTPLLLTVSEAADHLRVSRTEMWRIIGRRQVAVVKIGRLTRIRPDALRDFVLTLESRPRR